MKWFGKESNYVGIVFASVVIAPVAVYLGYFFIPGKLIIEPGDLLSYLGVSLGLIGTSFSFSFQRRNEIRIREEQIKKERLQRRPRLSLQLKSATGNFFLLSIINIGSTTISDIYLYDEHIQDYLMPRERIERLISFTAKPNHDYISLSHLTDTLTFSDGYPAEIEIDMFDEMNYEWHCTGSRIVDGNSSYYFGKVEPGAFEIESNSVTH